MTSKESEKTPHWSYFGGNGWLRTGLQYMGKGTGNPDGNAAKHMSYFGDNGWLVVNKELNISGNRFKDDSKGWLTQMMKVIFMDGLGNEISTQYVEKGKKATPPENPTRSGYEFDGWDKNFTNVKKDLTVNAKWDINTYKVVFTDGQGKTLKTQTVQYGKSASAPDDPIRSGYTFAGWDRSYDDVKGNLTVNAKWKENVAPAPAVKTYTVKFISEDTLLKTETVESGKAATAPPDLTRYFYSDIYNYKFVGWDTKFDKITQDTTVTALWEENKLQYKYDVKFVTQPYADTGTPVFVETDNPDPGSFSFSFLKADGSENELWLEPTRYDDLSYDTPGPGSIGTIGILCQCDVSVHSLLQKRI